MPAPGGGPPLKVLWAIKGLGPGGAETLLVSAARVADHDEFRFDACYVVPWKSHLVATLRSFGVGVHPLSPGPTTSRTWPLRLRRLVRDEAYDVVHTHSPLVAGVTRLVLRTLPRGRRPAVVSTEHSVWQQLALPTLLLNAVTCRWDAARLAVSRPVLASMWGPLQAGVEVLIHGIVPADVEVPAGTRERVREQLGLPPDAVVACTVANLRQQKGYPDLLAAASSCVARSDRLWFLSVGQGVQERELKDLHASLGLGERFRFLGHRTDVMEILAASDVFVMASRFEGFPVSVMEAMASGLPVVATDVGGLPDAVQDGVSGFITPVGDRAALARAVLCLAEDDERRALMGRAARERGRTYDVTRTQQVLQSHYRAASTRRRRRRPALRDGGSRG